MGDGVKVQICGAALTGDHPDGDVRHADVERVGQERVAEHFDAVAGVVQLRDAQLRRIGQQRRDRLQGQGQGPWSAPRLFERAQVGWRPSDCDTGDVLHWLAVAHAACWHATRSRQR